MAAELPASDRSTIAPGMPLITAFRWDTGVQVRVGPESLNASAAVTNGTSSDPRTRDNNGGKQIAGRLQWRPSVGLALGGSAASGAYVADAALASATIACGHVTARSSTRSVWTRSTRATTGWCAASSSGTDGRCPTLSQHARRHERVRRRALQDFARLLRGGPNRSPRLQRPDRHQLGNRTWDAPVTRLETGVGYYIRRNLLAKGTYQHNWRDGGRRHEPRAVRGAAAFLVVA